MNPRDLFDKKITLHNFFRSIAHWQTIYWAYEDTLNKPGITAREVEYICRQQNEVAEKVAKFILDRNMTVEILNNALLENI